MTIHTQWQDSGIYRTFSGHVTGEEIMLSNFSLHEDKRFLQASYIINDFSQITQYSVDPEHVDALAASDEIITHSKGRLKIALIAPHPEIQKLANSYAASMQGSLFQCQVFQDKEQAQQWASLP